GPQVMLGDLALLRGEHREAERAYRAALAIDPGDPQARVNLALALLRWDPPRPHHDPAWPVDPRETGRARRAFEVWSRQVRLLVAVATIVIAGSALLLDWGTQARLAGFAVLVLLVPMTVRQARRVGLWRYAGAMLARDPWLGASVVSAALSAVAFAGWLLLGAVQGLPASLDPVWAGLAGIAVLGWPALAALRALAEAWRGHPLRALAETGRAGETAQEGERASGDGPAQPRKRVWGDRLAPASGGGLGREAERAAWRNTGVALWLVLGRTWSVLVALLGAALAVEPGLAVAAVVVPYPLVRGCLRARRRGDRWLAAATWLVVLAAGAGAAGGLL
ncbi:tetratricopeptide repeat protein, partial [Nonomuraea maheshkhaliensis]|uniref:tetratricopeptide repeat protein n=1 Tax=Nonomuraea maheshkhaliensis TaxID=419590 RepID=UPI0031F7BA2B